MLRETGFNCTEEIPLPRKARQNPTRGFLWIPLTLVGRHRRHGVHLLMQTKARERDERRRVQSSAAEAALAIWPPLLHPSLPLTPPSSHSFDSSPSHTHTLRVRDSVCVCVPRCLFVRRRCFGSKNNKSCPVCIGQRVPVGPFVALLLLPSSSSLSLVSCLPVPSFRSTDETPTLPLCSPPLTLALGRVYSFDCDSPERTRDAPAFVWPG